MKNRMLLGCLVALTASVAACGDGGGGDAGASDGGGNTPADAGDGGSTPAGDTGPATDTGTVGGDTGPEGDAGPTAAAQVRVLHLIAGVPAAATVDIFLDDATTAAVSDLEVREITAFMEVPSGTHDIVVRAAGAPTSPALVSLEGVELAAGTSYTIVARLQGTDDGAIPALSAIAEQTPGTLPADITSLRAVHAAPLSPVDVFSFGEDGTPTRAIDNLLPGTASAALRVPSGSINLGVQVDGTDADPAPANVAALQAYFAAAIGDGVVDLYAATFPVPGAAGPVPGVVAVTPTTAAGVLPPAFPLPPPRLAILHLSPGTPNVDVFVNGEATPSIDNLTFPTGTGAITGANNGTSGVRGFFPGTYDIIVRADGSTATAIDLSDTLLPLGPYNTVAAIGATFAGDAGTSAEALRPLVLSNLTGARPTTPALPALPTGQVRLQAVHAGVGVGEVDLGTVAAGVFSPIASLSGLAFGESAITDVAAATALVLGVNTDADATDAEVEFDVPATLTAGQVVNAFVVNRSTSSADVVLVLQTTLGGTSALQVIQASAR